MHCSRGGSFLPIDITGDGPEETNMDASYEPGWRPWPVSWSGIWIGALSALAVGLIIGLIGYAMGAHQYAAPRTTTWRNVRVITSIFNIAGAFFAFVVGGWVAARITGVRRAEPAILHGVIAWLVTIPIMLVLAALGATGMYGGWYGGLVSAPAWVAAPPPMTPELAAAVRNGALAAAVAMLLGLLGATLGGWMASGEPMTIGHYRRRVAEEYERPRRAA
jgi:hypothetical protein